MARMRQHKVKPDIVTYNAFLHTCAKSCHVHGYPLVRRAWRMLHVLRAHPRGLRPSVISYNAVAHACARAAAAAPAVKMRREGKDAASTRHGREGKWAGGGRHAVGGDDKLSTVFGRGRLLEEMLGLEGMMRDDGVAADLRSFSTLLHGLARGIDRMVVDTLAIPAHDARAGRNGAGGGQPGRIRRPVQNIGQPAALLIQYNLSVFQHAQIQQVIQ